MLFLIRHEIRRKCASRRQALTPGRLSIAHAGIVLLSLAAFAFAQTPAITEYPVPSGLAGPGAITGGPDGAVWFTGSGALGRITANGSVTLFPLSDQSGLSLQAGHVTTGPDGALWVTTQSLGMVYISRLDAQRNVTAKLSVGTGSDMDGPQSTIASLTNGPDGAFWGAVPLVITIPVHGQSMAGGYVQRVTLDGVTSSKFTTATTTSSGGPYAVAAGFNAVWFTELGAIAKIVPATRVITEYPLPRATTTAGSIVAAGDGAMWFTEESEDRIGRIAWDGTVTEYELPNTGSAPTSIVLGPDGALWFVEQGVTDPFSGVRTGGNRIGRITTAGAITEYAIPTAGSGVTALAAAGDGALWFTEATANQIGKLVAVASPLSIAAPAALGTATVGAVYPAKTLQAQGGTAPYSWSATGLPPGMTLTGGGVLSGTPTFSGNYTVNVQATDSSSPALVARRSYTLDVNSAAALTIATAGTLPDATAGTAYTVTVSALGGVPPYAWSVIGMLPAGLNLDAGSGVLSGTPTTAGSNHFGIVVTDSTQFAATLSATLTVAAAGSSGGGTASRSGVLSQVAYGGGWQSSIYLMNPSASPVSLTLNFHSDAGSALSLPLVVTQGANTQSVTASAVTATLAAYASMVVAGEPDAVTGSAETSGWVEVLSAQPVTGYEVFHYTSLEGVQSEGTVPLETTPAAAFVLPFDNLNHFETGVALTNLSAQAALVAATIWDEDGKQLGVQSIEVPASGHVSFLLSDQLPAATATRGMVQFRSTSGGNVTGLGLRVNPLGGFTSVPKVAGVQ